MAAFEVQACKCLAASGALSSGAGGLTWPLDLCTLFRHATAVQYCCAQPLLLAHLLAAAAAKVGQWNTGMYRGPRPLTVRPMTSPCMKAPACAHAPVTSHCQPPDFSMTFSHHELSP